MKASPMHRKPCPTMIPEEAGWPYLNILSPLPTANVTYERSGTERNGNKLNKRQDLGEIVCHRQSGEN